MDTCLPVRRAGAWRAATAATIAGIVTTPAFAATSLPLQGALSGFTLREWLMTTSLLLLVVALVARRLRGRDAARRDGARREGTGREGATAADVPDLRWWRNPIEPGTY